MFEIDLGRGEVISPFDLLNRDMVLDGDTLECVLWFDFMDDFMKCILFVIG
jgi:hypothetical protein